jgi:hypothetical protein
MASVAKGAAANCVDDGATSFLVYYDSFYVTANVNVALRASGRDAGLSLHQRCVTTGLTFLNGPHVSDRYPLAYTYFTRTPPSNACGTYNSSFGSKAVGPLEYADILDGVDGQYIMANNGWIWGNSDPLRDFAAPGSQGMPGNNTR